MREGQHSAMLTREEGHGRTQQGRRAVCYGASALGWRAQGRTPTSDL